MVQVIDGLMEQKRMKCAVSTHSFSLSQTIV